METEHTPGPWTVHDDPDNPGFCTIYPEKGHPIGGAQAYFPPEDARLLSSVFMLKEALEPFSHFGEAVVRFADGSGNFPKTGELYCLHGHGLEERTITVEHFRAALDAVAKATEAP